MRLNAIASIRSAGAANNSISYKAMNFSRERNAHAKHVDLSKLLAYILSIDPSHKVGRLYLLHHW